MMGKALSDKLSCPCDRSCYLCPPTRGEGGHIGFIADPVGSASA